MKVTPANKLIPEARSPVALHPQKCRTNKNAGNFPTGRLPIFEIEDHQTYLWCLCHLHSHDWRTCSVYTWGHLHIMLQINKRKPTIVSTRTHTHTDMTDIYIYIIYIYIQTHPGQHVMVMTSPLVRYWDAPTSPSLSSWPRSSSLDSLGLFVMQKARAVSSTWTSHANMQGWTQLVVNWSYRFEHALNCLKTTTPNKA